MKYYIIAVLIAILICTTIIIKDVTSDYSKLMTAYKTLDTENNIQVKYSDSLYNVIHKLKDSLKLKHDKKCQFYKKIHITVKINGENIKFYPEKNIVKTDDYYINFTNN